MLSKRWAQRFTRLHSILPLEPQRRELIEIMEQLDAQRGQSAFLLQVLRRRDKREAEKAREETLRVRALLGYAYGCGKAGVLSRDDAIESALSPTRSGPPSPE